MLFHFLTSLQAHTDASEEQEPGRSNGHSVGYSEPAGWSASRIDPEFRYTMLVRGGVAVATMGHCGRPWVTVTYSGAVLFCVARSWEAMGLMKTEASRQRLQWIPRYHVSPPWACGSNLPPGTVSREDGPSIQLLVIRLHFKSSGSSESLEISKYENRNPLGADFCLRRGSIQPLKF